MFHYKSRICSTQNFELKKLMICINYSEQDNYLMSWQPKNYDHFYLCQKRIGTLYERQKIPEILDIILILWTEIS